MGQAALNRAECPLLDLDLRVEIDGEDVVVVSHPRTLSVYPRPIGTDGDGDLPEEPPSGGFERPQVILRLRRDVAEWLAGAPGSIAVESLADAAGARALFRAPPRHPWLERGDVFQRASLTVDVAGPAAALAWDQVLGRWFAETDCVVPFVLRSALPEPLEASLLSAGSMTARLPLTVCSLARVAPPLGSSGRGASASQPRRALRVLSGCDPRQAVAIAHVHESLVERAPTCTLLVVHRDAPVVRPPSAQLLSRSWLALLELPRSPGEDAWVSAFYDKVLREWPLDRCVAHANGAVAERYWGLLPAGRLTLRPGGATALLWSRLDADAGRVSTGCAV